MAGPPFSIEWSRLARNRLRQIREFVAQDKPDAAEKLAIRIVTLAAALRHQPQLGRPGSIPGVRELVVGGTPYLIIYRAARKRITVLNVWHGARRRES